MIFHFFAVEFTDLSFGAVSNFRWLLAKMTYLSITGVVKFMMLAF